MPCLSSLLNFLSAWLKLDSADPKSVSYLLSALCVALSLDGQQIVTGSRERPIELWELNTGKQIRSLAAYSNYVNFVAITSDGQTLVSSLDGAIELWNLETGERLRTLADSSATSLAISPDGYVIASNIADQKIKL